MAQGTVHVPWYATLFRGDRFEEALAEISAIAPRYGATSYSVHRYRDDRYKFLQILGFGEKAAFTAYWEGPEFTRWRAIHSGWFQVPVVYGWADLSAQGAMPTAAELRGPTPAGDLAG